MVINRKYDNILRYKFNVFDGSRTFKIKTESSQGKLEEVVRRGRQTLLKRPERKQLFASAGIPRQMRTAVDCHEYELLNAVFLFGF